MCWLQGALREKVALGRACGRWSEQCSPGEGYSRRRAASAGPEVGGAAQRLERWQRRSRAAPKFIT